MAKSQAQATAVNPASVLKEIGDFMQQQQTKITQAIDALLLKKRELTAEIDEQIEALDEAYHKATGRYYVGGAGKQQASKSGGRMTKQQKEQAKGQVLSLLGSGEKSMSEIAEAIGLPTASARVVVKALGNQIKSKGEKAQTRYSLAK